MKLSNFLDLREVRPEMFGTPDMMDRKLLRLLDVMIGEESKRFGPLKINVHSSFRGGDPGQHGLGKAVDFDLELENGILVPSAKLFLMASRYLFTGLGFYPYWNRPGIHADTRTVGGSYLTMRRAYWWKDKEGNYRRVYDWFN